MIALQILVLAAPLVLEKGPVLADVSTRSVEVRWEPAVPGAVLVIGSGAGAIAVPAETLPEGVQRARASDLEPDRAYRYVVRAGEATSELASFRTLPASPDAPVSFVAYGDSRANQAQHARVIAEIRAADPDFIVSTGDLVEDGRNPDDWTAFFRVAGELLANVPFFPAVGNHDVRGVFEQTLIDRWFAHPRWNEVIAGPVLFLFLDTNMAYGEGSLQGTWLREKLALAQRRRAEGTTSWVVVLHHHPAFSSAHHGSHPRVQRDLVPLYEAAAVDVVFTGHDHVYERSEHGGVVYVVTGGAGAPLYEFHEPIPESRVRARTHHWVHVNADRERLSWRARDLDGNVIDEVELRAGRARPARREPEPARIPLAASLGALALAALVAWVASGKLVR